MKGSRTHRNRSCPWQPGQRKSTTRKALILKLVLAVLALSVFELRLSGQTTLVSTGAVWKYLDNGTDQGTTWIAPAFDDSAWASGPAQLGYGDGDEATLVDDSPAPVYIPGAQNRYITTYFRRSFTVPDASVFTSLQLTLLYDDGAAVYLNGVEVFRVNLPAVAAFNAVASGPASENNLAGVEIPPAALISGNNVLAVEIHQMSATSSDISFDLGLSGSIEIFITQPPQSQIVNVGNNATFCVTASSGAPLSYQWQFNGTNISGATDTCYTRTNAQLADAGGYNVVVTNLSGSVISSGASLTVTPWRIGWFTMDGGGGTSTNGTVTLRGTIGQLDAGRLTNGTTVLNGGFWGGLAVVQTPGAPLLTITLNSQLSTINVSWPSPSTGFQLQQNTNDVSSVNWSNAPGDIQDDGTNRTLVVNPPTGNRFYRLIKP